MNYIWFLGCTLNGGDTQQRSWLKHYATSQKVMGSIPNEVTGFFQFT
jgi:hypothetical protein